MQGTQSRRASGSWRRNGRFAALRYVSRHLEMAAGLSSGDVVKWEAGSRWRLLRADELSPAEGDAGEGAPGWGKVSDREKQGAAGWPRC